MSENYKKTTMLSTQDSSGHRLNIHPAVVKGLWYQRRKIFQWALLVVFLVIPWLEIGGHPILQFNIPDRRFYILGLNLWAHDAPLIFFVFALAGFGLFFVTALWGRVWCGWACPQTVFIERVFRQIEIWTEGNHTARKKLDNSDMSFNKLTRKSIKWVLFIGMAWLISNSFIAYFIGKDQLFEMMLHNPKDNPVSFVIMAFFFGGVLFNFVWFREQFCTLACPYGRFQSVLMDSNSLLVAYDEKRGEARGKLKKDPPSSQGDCIDCNKCVAVCPTGIDIRNGTQMECIACTACIDACDDVMAKINKPLGLIKYTSEDQLDGKKRVALPPRSMAYLAIIIALTGGLLFSLSQKQNLTVSELRHAGSPFEILKTPEGADYIQNVVRLRVHNSSDLNYNIQIELLEASDKLVFINPIPSYPAGKNSSFELSLIFKAFSREDIGRPLTLRIFDPANDYEKTLSIQLLGPRGD